MPISRSFPSGHAAAAFAFATGVGHVSPGGGRPAARARRSGRLLARPHGRALSRRRARRRADRDDARAAHGDRRRPARERAPADRGRARHPRLRDSYIGSSFRRGLSVLDRSACRRASARSSHQRDETRPHRGAISCQPGDDAADPARFDVDAPGSGSAAATTQEEHDHGDRSSRQLAENARKATSTQPRRRATPATRGAGRAASHGGGARGRGQGGAGGVAARRPRRVGAGGRPARSRRPAGGAGGVARARSWCRSATGGCSCRRSRSIAARRTRWRPISPASRARAWRCSSAAMRTSRTSARSARPTGG